MQKILKNYWLITYLCIGVLIIGIFLFSMFGVRNIRGGENVQFEEWILIDKKIVQTIKAEADHLNIIELYFKNPGYGGIFEYSFNLLAENGDVLRELKFSNININNETWLRLQFDPIKESEKKIFQIEIKPISQTDTPLLLGIGGSAYIDGALVQGSTKDADVMFKVFYRNNNKVNGVLKIGKNFVHKIIQDSWFLSVWMLVVTSGVIYSYSQKNEN